MVLFSFGRESIGFLLVEHFGVSLVLLWDEFGGGDGGFSPFCPCFGPRHVDFPSFPVDFWVEGSQPGVSEYYAVFPQARFIEACDMPLVSALNGHFAVLFDSSCLVGCSVDVGKLNWLCQGLRLDT